MSLTTIPAPGRRSTWQKRSARLLAPAMVVALLLTGCGGGSSADANLGKDVSVEARGQLPDTIKDRGYVSVATTFGSPPLQFNDENDKPAGSTIDFGNALGKKLGIEFRQVSAPFDGIVAGLNSHRYDLSIGGMSVTDERRKVLNFVVYLNAAVTMIVKSDRSSKLKKWEDFCGLSVGQVKGSIQIDQVNAASETHCKAKGLPAIKVVTFNGSDDIYQAVETGRIDGSLRDAGFQKYAVEHSDGKLALADDIFETTGSYGIATLADDKGFGEALTTAMNELIEDGTYSEILKKWGLEDTGVKTAEFLPRT